MNSESRIGPALMSRRVELGISIEQAARDTNLRARMLEIIESCDYSQYPPRGHAIGMLSSYARYLGLDSAAIVEAFDAEFEAFTANQEIAKMANNTRRGVGRFGERISEAKSRPINREQSRARSQRKRNGSQPESSSKLKQNLKDEALAQDDERYKSGSVRVVGTRATGSFRPVRNSRPPARSSAPVPPDSSASFRRVSSTGSMKRVSQAGSMKRASQTGSMRRYSPQDPFASSDSAQSHEENATPDYFGVGSNQHPAHSGSRRRSSSRSRDTSDAQRKSSVNDTIFTRLWALIVAIFSETRTRIIAAVVIIIVIAVIVAASILISTAGNAHSGTLSVQGGADAETTILEGENASHKTITTANGNPVLIRIEVEPGQTSVVEVTYDGGMGYKGTAVGGQFSREFSVAEYFSGTFSNPAAVTLTENGIPMEIPLNENGDSGSLYISIQNNQ